MRFSLKFFLLILPLCAAVHIEPAEAGSKWSRLSDIDKNLAHLRRSGLYPFVTGLTCRFQNNDPRIRFTYQFSDKMVRYNYAYSTNGKATYDKFARKHLTANSQIISCSSGNFHFGVQNLTE